MIGKPALPPFWAFGWYENSKNYKTLDEVRDNLKEYSYAKFQLQAILLAIIVNNHFKNGFTDCS